MWLFVLKSGSGMAMLAFTPKKIPGSTRIITRLLMEDVLVISCLFCYVKEVKYILFNNLTSVFYASVLLLIINCVITLSK